MQKVRNEESIILSVIHKNQTLDQSLLCRNLRSKIRHLESKLRDYELNKSHQRITLKTSQRTYFIRVSEIEYCEADGNYTRIHLTLGKSILISKTLRSIQWIVKEFSFIRCHQSYLVNKSNIIGIDRTNGNYLLLESESVIPIARRKLKMVVNLFQGAEPVEFG